MDFEKIYSDFEVAQANHDLEKMSDLFIKVNVYCNALAQAGRGNEIPPSAIHIGQHANILIYYVTKLLNDNEADKAKAYILSLAKGGITEFDKFFHMLYLLGRILYTTGDYSRAMKIFNRYEQNRYARWNDLDELSLFYRANCAAMLGDFNVATRLYEQILTIKADFPEAKENLELLLHGSNQNIAREVKSLWNFPYWQDVPIFINARDRLGVMKKLIDWILDAGYRKLIILDNNSTYPPLLEYYSVLERDSRVKIILLGKNLGYKALWLSGVLERLQIATPYVYTDPDILPIERCPKDFVKQMMKILDANHEIRKVGLGLVTEDITFFNREECQKNAAKLFNGTQVGDNLYFAQVDTTFAIYSNVRHYSLRFSLRTTGNLRAYHLPWYYDYDNLPDDEKYYLEHAESSSSTSEQFKQRRQ